MNVLIKIIPIYKHPYETILRNNWQKCGMLLLLCIAWISQEQKMTDVCKLKDHHFLINKIYGIHGIV